MRISYRSLNLDMMIMKYLIPILLIAALVIGCNQSETTPEQNIQKASMHTHQSMNAQADSMDKYEVQLTEEQWRERLTSDEYRILRGRGTELPYINKYYDSKKEGVYYCGACGQPVFTSETKYESGTGWPSFWKPIKPSVVGEKKDESFFMTRTETVCSRCGSHLGHVFEDGPEPTGLRYCLNSLALDFEEMDLSETDVANLPIKQKEGSN